MKKTILFAALVLAFASSAFAGDKVASKSTEVVAPQTSEATAPAADKAVEKKTEKKNHKAKKKSEKVAFRSTGSAGAQNEDQDIREAGGESPRLPHPSVITNTHPVIIDSSDTATTLRAK